jgi:hypothetical protein
MSTRLTDEQVAELATCDAYIHPDDLMALAAEVQQARQRRCENCRDWNTTDYRAGFGACMNDWLTRPTDWFCADFTPRGAK